MDDLPPAAVEGASQTRERNYLGRFPGQRIYDGIKEKLYGITTKIKERDYGDRTNKKDIP